MGRQLTKLPPRGPLLLGMAFALFAGLAAPAPAAEPALTQINLTVLPTGTIRTLLGVSFVGAHGVAVGGDGTVVATSDGGRSWSTRDAPVKAAESDNGGPQPDSAMRETGLSEAELRFTKEGLLDVTLVDPQHGYAVGLAGSILRTTDGGQTWESLRTPDRTTIPAAQIHEGRVLEAWSFRSVSFVDRNQGVAAGSTSSLLTTTDGGATWTFGGDARYQQVQDVSLVDRERGFAVGSSAAGGNAYTAIATSDGGRTWQPLKASGVSAREVNFRSVSFVDPLRGHVVGPGAILATSDGGRSWREQRDRTVEELNSVSFVSARRGVAIGVIRFSDHTRSIVLATDDGGSTWRSRLPDVEFLWDVDFADADTAYAVGCRRGRGTCTESGVVEISFSEETGQDGGVSSGPNVLLVGLAGLAVGLLAAAAIARRRR